MAELLFKRDPYSANCTADWTRPSCEMSEPETAKRDLVASLRLIFALLSILGTVSIIVSVIRKKQVLNPKVHAIFMLSIADLVLAIMWVVGGSVWMSGGLDKDHSRVGCFTMQLMTVILECVTINLTCVYALLTYSTIKRKDFSNVYSLFDKEVESQAWKPWKIIVAYIVSWVLPVILVMVPFSLVASYYHLVRDANKCSCRCLPYFGNVVPMASPRDNDTAYYLHHMSMLVASYGMIVVGHYLVGFVLLVVVYWKILKLIQKVKKNLLDQTGVHKTYGVTSNIIVQGQSRAKQRVVYFLTVFLISGFFNLVLSFAFVVYESVQLRHVPTAMDREDVLPLFVLLMYLGQSVTVPLQGFLNAIVYGWTRSDFIQAVRSDSNNIQNQETNGEQMSSSETSNLFSNPTADGDSFPSKSWVSREILSSIPEQPH